MEYKQEDILMTKKVRTFNMTGRIGGITRSTPKSKRLHIGDMRSGKVYAILDFRVYPGDTYVASQLNGTLTMKEDPNTDPRVPDFGNTGEIAWSSHNQTLANTGVGVTNLNITETSHRDDERYFAKDVVLTVTDEEGTSDINYYVKIGEFEAAEDVSAVVQLIQFSELLGQL
jgi:hypothetical protein